MNDMVGKMPNYASKAELALMRRIEKLEKENLKLDDDFKECNEEWRICNESFNRVNQELKECKQQLAEKTTTTQYMGQEIKRLRGIIEEIQQIYWNTKSDELNKEMGKFIESLREGVKSD